MWGIILNSNFYLAYACFLKQKLKASGTFGHPKRTQVIRLFQT